LQGAPEPNTTDVDRGHGGDGDLGPRGLVVGQQEPQQSADISAVAVVSDIDDDFPGSSGDDISEASVPRGSRAAGPMLRRHLSEPSTADWLIPPAWPHSLQWWTEPILNCLKLVTEARGRQGLRRGISLIAVCSGTVAELWIAAALGIPISECITCDIDSDARDFAKRFHGTKITHMFHHMSALQKHVSVGDCSIHGSYCVEEHGDGPDARPDLLSGGPPCPPYSAARPNTKSTPPEDHQDFAAIFGGPGTKGGSYLQTVRLRRPRGGSAPYAH
jgi:hypothetical protein